MLRNFVRLCNTVFNGFLYYHSSCFFPEVDFDLTWLIDRVNSFFVLFISHTVKLLVQYFILLYSGTIDLEGLKRNVLSQPKSIMRDTPSICTEYSVGTYVNHFELNMRFVTRRKSCISFSWIRIPSLATYKRQIWQDKHCRPSVKNKMLFKNITQV